MTVQLSLAPYAYLSLEETKDWLKIGRTAADTTQDTTLTRLINAACERVESFIDGPVLTRSFVEYADGNNSNVVVPTYSPVKTVESVHLDFNREFGSTTEIDGENIVLRGFPSMKQIQGSTVSVAVNGTDIILRDDSNVSILGRIMTGSTVQSLRMIYTAGLGATASELPNDILLATLMLVDFLFVQKENRDLGIRSKGTFGGQSYTRADIDEDSGMPKEIVAMLEKYKDYALPSIAQPQRNTFGI